MPLSSKSAVTTGKEFEFAGGDVDTGYLGDLHSHTYRLNMNPDISMFTEDGKYVALDDDDNAIVRVEFACVSCHNGEVAPAQTADWMYANASVVHSGGPVDVALLNQPESFDLHPNYPNPFNPVTNIRYDLKDAGYVKLNVYDVRGVLVSTLAEKHQEAGRYFATWNGLTDEGRKVSSGVYFYRLQIGDFNTSRRMALLR